MQSVVHFVYAFVTDVSTIFHGQPQQIALTHLYE